MGKESLQSDEQRRGKFRKNLPNALRGAATAGIIIGGSLAPHFAHNTFAKNLSDPEIFNNIPSVSSQEKDEQLSNLLKSDEARAILITGLGLSIAALTSAYLLGKKYDGGIEEKIRMAGPTLATLATGSLLLDSYETLSSDIPASLILGTSLMMAAHTVVNTFEHEADLKLRASAFATAGFMLSVGITTFVALSDRFKSI